MKRILGISVALFCTSTLAALTAVARPGSDTRHQLSSPDVYVDVVGDVDGTHPAPQKVLQDTMWIATWTFDTGACDGPLPAGWQKGDNHIRTGGDFFEPGAGADVFWSVDSAFDLVGGISGNAARLGYVDNACAVDVAGGYSFGWYQGIRIEYLGGGGAPNISFDYLLDSEDDFDFLRVEEDSACASFDRVDPHSPTMPRHRPHDFRNLLLEESGLNTSGAANVALTDFGAGTHCVYIAFLSDVAFDPFDGLHPTNIGAGLVVDNIVLTDAGAGASEEFTNGLEIGTFVNMWDAAPFGPVAEGGSWARTFHHITDNDLCSENLTCALLWTDFTTPSIANSTEMAFAPSSYVVKNWLDDVILTPWVSLASTPNATGTLLAFRRFDGNNILEAWIVQNWAVRGGFDVGDGMGGTIACTENWGHVFSWTSLPRFFWYDRLFDASIDFTPTSERVQFRFRTSDWQWILGVGPPPAGFRPGPGPFNDRVKIGRIVQTGPELDEGIDARFQAQDAFPTEINPLITPGTGEHFRPSTDRFGTAAFSYAQDVLGRNHPAIVPGDSITCRVEDVRGAGGVTFVGIYAAIVSGPHAGMAPPPHSVDATGFFVVEADTSRFENTVIQGNYFVDLDDEYFVGGDVLHYFWAATDAQGGFASLPFGVPAPPASIAEAQQATGGMFEVSFLPTHDWDPDYLDAVALNNKVDPNSNPTYLDQTSQKNCILYYQGINSRRRSGDINRTSFMYVLDALGFKGHYDVYDHQGYGNTNNQLGGRATVEQAQGYSLIVYDTGNQRFFLIPNGNPNNLDSENVDQEGWFQSWLGQAAVSEAGQATLWLIGSDFLDDNPTLELYATDMQTSRASSDQGLNANPDVEGQGTFTFHNGAVADFSVGARAKYSLAGGCPTIEDYDGQSALGTGVEVYLYADPNTSAVGDAAIVMNANAAESYNTILQSHAWFDIREESGSNPGNNSGMNLLNTILDAVVPLDCLPDNIPTDPGGEPPQIDAPTRSALYQNTPNPFNPLTTIRFDLARRGNVRLSIYDAAGRLVRTVLNRSMEAKRHRIVWDGTDESRVPVSSGIYFYRLEAPDFQDTRKLVVLR